MKPAGTRLPWASSLGVAVVQVIGTHFAAQHQAPHRAPLDAYATVLLLVGPGLLLLRHRYPRSVAFGTAAAAALYLGAGYPYGPVFVSVAVGCFAALVAGRRWAAWGAVGLLWAAHLVIGHWLYRWLPPAGDQATDWAAEFGVAAWAAAVLSIAELVRLRREQWARRRAEQEEARRRRADEERLRIARELHDVLAHSISVINVQAGVGLALLDSDPEQARAALTTIRTAGKEALGEVRHVLDALRAPGGDAPRAPAPGLDRLPELTAQAEAAGLTVTVRTTGAATPLPPGVDLAAFRIVQEALTNVVRHSGSRTARVRLGYAARELTVQVDDDGPARENGPPSGGNGLAGMRERAAALGGTLEAGPRDGDGFRVCARLPLGGPSGSAETDRAAGDRNGRPQ
jgi:signal transduction histidine kinase